MRDLRQTEKYANYLKRIGWIVEEHHGVFYFIKKVFFFSIIKIQRPIKIDLEFIRKMAKKYRAFQIFIEPNSSKETKRLLALGFKTASPSLPSKTIILDLNLSEEKLLAQMHPKTRYNIKLAAKRGINIVHSDKVEEFADFWQKNRKGALPQKRFIINIFKAFDDQAVIIEAKYKSELVAAVLLLIASKTAYYMYAAANTQGKKLFAPTLATWEAITLAKKMGATEFDFEGVFDERFPLPSWEGFSKFKKTFGGRELSFPGAYRSFYIRKTRKKDELSS